MSDFRELPRDRLAEMRDHADHDLLDPLYPDEVYALLDIAETAAKWITSGRDADHPVRTLGEVADEFRVALVRLDAAMRRWDKE